MIYKLSGGVEQVIYTFSGTDGYEPNGGLVLDKSGNIYGTTYKSTKGAGTVFKVMPGGSYTLLHPFGSGKGDGMLPTSGLLMDKKGNIYGTTSAGGQAGLYGPESSACPGAGSYMRSGRGCGENSLHL